MTHCHVNFIRIGTSLFNVIIRMSFECIPNTYITQ